MNEAPVPVPLDELKTILDSDLVETLRSGVLSPAQSGGVVIGLLHGNKRLALTYEKGRIDGLYEIGSITKTFIGLLLAQMVEEHRVRLDTPLRELLPGGMAAKPFSAREITLLDLSTHYSGLPRLPGNLHPADLRNPYAGYGAEQLYAFIGQQGTAMAADVSFAYSNLGTGLLGQVLAGVAGKSYEQLLQEKITGPLGMKETFIALPRSLQEHLVPGYDTKLRPAHEWDMASLSGAGGIRSTVNDMLTYLEAQLHPDRLSPSILNSPQGETLPAAIVASQILYREALPGMHIALNWLYVDNSGTYWHNGGTGGFSSYACFNHKDDFGLVVLCNMAASAFTDALGRHIALRFTGKPTTWIDKVSVATV